VRKIFSKFSCLECGVCCTEPKGIFKTAVTGVDPHRTKLRYLVRTNGYTTENAQNKGINILGEGRCVFLLDTDGKKVCQVYEARPLICSVFPFTMQEIEARSIRTGESEMLPLVTLTTACPPLKKAKEKGVTYLRFDELLRMIDDNGRKGYQSTLSPLGEALLNVILCANMGVVFSMDKILEIDGKGIFPIG
jgi:Fe-S-cluster containining protein